MNPIGGDMNPLIVIGIFMIGFAAGIHYTVRAWSKLLDEVREQNRRLLETWEPRRNMCVFNVRWDAQAGVYVATDPVTGEISQGTTALDAMAAAASAGRFMYEHYRGAKQ